MAHERWVAGLRCGQVLEQLSDYVDGALPPARREQIRAHLRGCDWCERFGGEYAATVAALRRHLAEPEPAPEPIRQRLREALDRKIRSGDERGG